MLAVELVACAEMRDECWRVGGGREDGSELVEEVENNGKDGEG